MNETDPLYSSYIANCVFNACSAYTAVVLNILTIHAIRNSSLLPKTLKTLLLSLAVSDLGVGLLVQPLNIAKTVNPTQNLSTLDIAYNIFAVIFVYSSVFTVVAISVDRFLALSLHLRYQELVTHKRVVVVVISIWILSVSMSLYFWHGSEKIALFIILTILGLCFICTTIVYCRIYLVVRRHKKRIQTMQVQAPQNGETRNDARQRKSAVSAFYVYLVFLVCSLPEYCALVASNFLDASSLALHGFFLYSGTLIFLNSCLNPIIYYWKMRHVRHAIIDSLRNILSSCNLAVSKRPKITNTPANSSFWTRQQEN